MTLMRFDPLRELDRWTDQALTGALLRTMPMEALRPSQTRPGSDAASVAARRTEEP